MTQTLNVFVSLLAILCQLFVASIVVLRLAAIVSPGAKRLWDAVAGLLGPVAIPLAFVIGLVTIGGSLYYSEVANYTPCKLCWFQRICLYPMPFFFAYAMLKKDKSVKPYALMLAIANVPISLYHYLIEWYPDLEGNGACDITASCTSVYVREFGYVSIPLMALSAALAIITLMLFVRRDQPSSKTDAA